MHLPDYLPAEVKNWLIRASMTRKWGHLNIYECEKCGYDTVTTDLEEGVTPFTIKCRNPKPCDGVTRSMMYMLPQLERSVPLFGWYRPDTLEGLDPYTVAHIERGGLILRELTPKDWKPNG